MSPMSHTAADARGGGIQNGKRHLDVSDEVLRAGAGGGGGVKKIKVVRRQENVPGIRCARCPSLTYGFLSEADLRVHHLEVHGEGGAMWRE